MSALTNTLGELFLKTPDEAKAVLESPALDQVRSDLVGREEPPKPLSESRFSG